MSVFKEDTEYKRVIFNVEICTFEALESIKNEAKEYGKKLDVDSAVNEALQKFVKKARKKLDEMRHEAGKAKKKGAPAAARESEDGDEAPGEGTPLALDEK